MTASTHATPVRDANGLIDTFRPDDVIPPLPSELDGSVAPGEASTDAPASTASDQSKPAAPWYLSTWFCCLLAATAGVWALLWVTSRPATPARADARTAPAATATLGAVQPTAAPAAPVSVAAWSAPEGYPGATKLGELASLEGYAQVGQCGVGWVQLAKDGATLWVSSAGLTVQPGLPPCPPVDQPQLAQELPLIPAEAPAGAPAAPAYAPEAPAAAYQPPTDSRLLVPVVQAGPDATSAPLPPRQDGLPIMAVVPTAAPPPPTQQPVGADTRPMPVGAAAPAVAPCSVAELGTITVCNGVQP